MPPLSRSLEVELGTPGVGANAVTGFDVIDDWEAVPELRWPASVVVYDRMRRDSQLAAILRATLQPLRGQARWRLGSEGCDPRVLAFVATEMGLTPERVARARRPREGISWDPYVRQALGGKLAFGHSVFEQIYRLGPPSPAQLDAGGAMPPVLAHLRKLAPRPARTLAGFDTAPDGGLVAVKQFVSRPGRPYETVSLGVERVVVHVHEMEGADWRGNSLLRPAWKHWVIRDLLIRLGPMAVERNGMGVPVVTFDPNIDGANRATALRIAKAFRAGDEAGVALPPGYTVTLLGVAGTVRDEVPLIKYHGEQMGRSALAMVLDLGHDDGARALGDTFAQLFTSSLNALADDFAEEVTEYVIRDLVELNFGSDEAYPPLIHDQLSPAQVLTPEALARLVVAGAVVPDDYLEVELRRRWGLPLWEGAPDGPVDFDLEGVVQVDPDADPPTAPAPVVTEDDLAAAGHSSAALAAALEALQARLAARDAARRR